MSDPWSIKKENFPTGGSMTEKIRFVLGYAILAPSTHNSQPWLFQIDNKSCRIYYDPKLELPQSDPKGRDLYISMGCLIENLIIAASYFGIFKELKLIFKENLLAEVVFDDGGEGNPDLEYLVEAIPRRVNARGVFKQEPLPGKIQGEFMSLNKDGRIKTDFITDKKQIEKLASVTAEGLRLAYKRPAFRKEMSGWMHNDFSSSKNGLPGYSLRMPFILSFIIPVLVRFFDIGPLLARLNYKSMASVPFVCIFSSDQSGREMWLEIGRLAERYMLQLNAQDIRTTIFVASVEMGDLYKKVQEVTGSSLIPQFIFCAGYMDHVQRHSPRMGVDEKMI